MRITINRREALLASLAAAGALPCARAFAQELLPPANAAASIRLLFYNTHLLPTIAQKVAGHRGQDDYRTAAIAAKLYRYDLIGLCEVFESRRRKEIVEVVQRDSRNTFHVIEQPKPWGRHLIGSGLMLLSRYPIVGEPHFITYHHASRVVTNGWKADGFAAKGAIHAQLQVREQPAAQLDCFLTHLESISPKARGEQIKELADFIAKHAHPERPAILIGDLNVAADAPGVPAADDSEYRQLTSKLAFGEQYFVDLWPAFHDTAGGTNDALAKEHCRRIDYAFISPPQPTGLTLEPTAIRVEPFLDAKVEQGSLSDHAALECNFVLR
ncbi:endonuclease/exonuclease/phosphatase family protein [Lacipirellula sp.]|uniref:endonuclease/exonuclease/phosphatase family protein n=1 Tax=Lacipirellula sp. TaxID=2691419 RepID=UPI003D0DE545